MKNAFNGNGLRREIGLYPATVLVIANMMGTGIFTTSGFIMAELKDPRAVLLCWLCGGVFALCGALCYGELGARFRSQSAVKSPDAPCKESFDCPKPSRKGFRNMKVFGLLISSLIFAALAASTGWAHGVEGFIEQADGYCITARYDDGEPMSYAAVEIKNPESGTAFQTGRTDRNGRFMFHPDSPGRWQAVVKDGMGHRLALELAVGDDKAGPEADETQNTTTSRLTTRLPGIIAGLSIIFGLAGFGYGWKARRKPTPPNPLSA